MLDSASSSSSELSILLPPLLALRGPLGVELSESLASAVCCGVELSESLATASSTGCCAPRLAAQMAFTVLLISLPPLVGNSSLERDLFVTVCIRYMQYIVSTNEISFSSCMMSDIVFTTCASFP